MIDITPAILSPSLPGIAKSLLEMQGATSCIQIDVADGIFVPHQTWPYAEGQTIEALQTLDSIHDITIEVDLMVVHPLRDAQAWIENGARRVVVHSESPHSYAALAELQSNRAKNIRLGIALASSATIEEFKPFEKLVDFVQVMGIARIGQQGEPFDESALSTLSTLRWTYPHLELQVDGGVSMDTAQSIALAGANHLVVGSAIFSNENPKAALTELQELFTKN